MNLDKKEYSVLEKRFIMSKVSGLFWDKIPDSLKEFWANEYKKIINGERT